MIPSTVITKLLAGVVIVLVSLLVGQYLSNRATEATLHSKLRDANDTIQSQQTRIAELLGENVSLRAANSDFSVLTDQQNKRIAALLTERQRREKEAEEAIAAARREAAKWRPLYEDLLNRPPVNVGDICMSTEMLVDRYLKLRQEERAK